MFTVYKDNFVKGKWYIWNSDLGWHFKELPWCRIQIDIRVEPDGKDGLTSPQKIALEKKKTRLFLILGDGIEKSTSKGVFSPKSLRARSPWFFVGSASSFMFITIVFTFWQSFSKMESMDCKLYVKSVILGYSYRSAHAVKMAPEF